jgi:hypothetical protein
MPAKKRSAKKSPAKKHPVKKHQPLGSHKRSGQLSKKTAAPKKRRPVQRQKIKPGFSPKATKTQATAFALMAVSPSPSPDEPPFTQSPVPKPPMQKQALKPRY